MKIKLFTILLLLLLYITCSFSQKNNKETIIIVCEKCENTNKKTNLYNISNEDFRYIEGKHNKKNVSFQNINNNVITIGKLKSLTKQKLKNDNIKNNFIQIYFEKYFKIHVFVKNPKCKNEGTLYEVEWILSITETEVD